MLCEKELFLSNNKKQQHFIDLLSDALEKAGHFVTNCIADADVYIVQKTVERIKQSNTVVVADDTDVLILLLHYLTDAHHLNDVIMFRPSSKGFVKINEIIECTPRNVLNLILLVHAASGCDTVSALSEIGKIKLIKMLEKGLTEAIDLHVFYDDEISKQQLKKVGAKLLIDLYKADSTINSLEEQRLQ